MINVLFAAKPEAWAEYETHLNAAFKAASLDATLVNETDAPETVDYIVYAPNGPVRDFTPFSRLKAVQNLWAGVESVVRNETLNVPLCRMVDDGLTEGMVEWVTGHVLRHHLGIDTHIHGQDGIWRDEIVPPLARHRRLTMLGLGELGTACAQALSALNFDTHGWSRSPKEIAGVTCHHGDDGLRNALSAGEITVLLLPLTPATKNLLNADRLALMPKGAIIINPGRGPLIDDDALLAALDSDHIAHATLDVFRKEPLPEEHPYWAHPHVTVTPHIASATRVETASQVVADNIARNEAGEPLLHVVDRDAGY